MIFWKRKKKHKKKISSLIKNKKCGCGKKIKHHHFLCDDCWKENNETNRLKRKAMLKNRLLLNQTQPR